MSDTLDYLRKLNFNTGYNSDVVGSSTFCSAPSLLAQFPDYRNAARLNTRLTRFGRQVYGDYKPQFQKSGTCTGQGGKLCWDLLQATTAILYGNTRLINQSLPSGVRVVPYSGGIFNRASVAGGYAGGKVEIAGQPTRGEGASVSWIAEMYTKYGALLLKDMSLPEDATDEDEQLAMKWAASRAGIPDQLEGLMAPYRLKCAPRVTDTEEAAMAIANGFPVLIGSSLIPTGKRNSEGISPVRSYSGHAVAVTGVRFTSTSSDRPYAFEYQNSWGQWGDGPLWEDCLASEGSVWIDTEDMQAILSGGDSYAFISYAANTHGEV